MTKKTLMIYIIVNAALQVLQHIEKSDLGCGRGAGKNNGDVFDRTGLMILTNANAQTSNAGDLHIHQM